MSAKLDHEQMAEVRRLIDEILDDNGDPELVLTRLVAQRDEYRQL
jgi:hypothetical protein